MQFTTMSIWLFTGLAVLTAGVLAALQYLRIRPRQVRVVTTLFWEQAVDQVRARTLLERFRHPRTYLLLLAACLLILLALANPVFNTTHQPHRVILLEAGLAMTAADNRFENALELARTEAASLGEHHVAVVAADPHPRLLKHFDESMVVLENRLAKIQAADSRVIRKDLLREAKSLLAGRENGEVVLVSAQPVETGDDRVRVMPAGEVFDNAFILSASFVPDSTDLTRGTFQCRVGYTGKQSGTVTFKINQASKTLLERSVDFNPGEVNEFSAPEIAATGNILTASVTSDDAIGGDNRVDFQLPERRRILVTPLNGIEVPTGLKSVLDSLPEVTTNQAEGANLPVVRIGQAESDAHVLIQPVNESGELMAVSPSSHPLLEGLVFEDAVCRTPLTPLSIENDDLPLLLVDGSPVATMNRHANQLTVSGTIFDEDASLVRRTGYIVFWSKMLHHLAGWSNEPLTLSPVQASRSVDASARNLTLKADMTNFDLASTAKAAAIADGSPRLPGWQMLLIAALALMTLEAVLNIRGRIS